MADTTVEEQEEEARKPSKLPLIIGIVLALAGGGGGFFAVSSGMLGGGGGEKAAAESPSGEEGQAVPVDNAPLADIAFVEVPQLLISLGPTAQADHLRFRGSLEVPKQYAAEVEGLLPRVQDVMNSYLRALDPAMLEQPGALVKLRSQMLRRVSMVAGEGRIRDLLVLEFVLN
ncbi:flagellar basal body-associated FliL family protein [Tropicibacter oceani]|uniref:Flagellar protein FliL n=1 Tax=Tropicibacter oceani TaxID=3058420 RepID=A0ABY8QK05_9RHOB|nr:flagellar basal body-associated FliL family protein [Tropicibacter oceani]WGW04341.1 flagellar basal body-associated FliL family protein [Tropicibacter oceani]